MTKRINSYKELLEEQENLQLQLKNQRELIRGSAGALKDEFKPAFSAMSFLGSLVSRDSTNPILGTAANSIIDILFKKLLLARAGWIPRVIIPLLVKNMSSHYIADHETSIFLRIFSILGLGKKKKEKRTAEKTNGQPIKD
jgi:hypothetical protein